MNFYDILGVPSTATKYEIKKAYHKLAVQYHPDKCQGKEEKFQEIKTAYDVLYDDKKRQQYDSMDNDERARVFDLVKQYFTDIRPEYSYIYDSIIDVLYANNENEFKNDINELNIKKIFEKIGQKIKDNVKKKYIEVNVNEYDLYVKLREKYENSVKVIKVGDELYEVGLWKKVVILEGTDIGTVTINVICFDTDMYQQINDYDLLLVQKVSLSQYLYGGKVKICHLDGQFSFFEFGCCLEKKPVFEVEGKGLVCDDFKSRGILYVYVVIEGVNEDSGDNVSVSYASTVEETIKLMFPPICN